MKLKVKVALTKEKNYPPLQKEIFSKEGFMKLASEKTLSAFQRLS